VSRLVEPAHECREQADTLQRRRNNQHDCGIEGLNAKTSQDGGRHKQVHQYKLQPDPAWVSRRLSQLLVYGVLLDYALYDAFNVVVGLIEIVLQRAALWIDGQILVQVCMRSRGPIRRVWSRQHVEHVVTISEYKYIFFLICFILGFLFNLRNFLCLTEQ